MAGKPKSESPNGGSPQSGIPELKQQINVAIFALIINTGFLKFTEIDPFVKVLSQVGSPHITIGAAFMVLLIGLGYFVFIGCVAIGLLEAYRGRDVTKPMIYSLGAFFFLYVIMLARAFGNQPFISASKAAGLSLGFSFAA